MNIALGNDFQGEVPKDIWESVERDVAELVRMNPSMRSLGPALVYWISPIVAAERERCGAIADKHAEALRENFDRSCAIAVEGVAKAIRA